MLIIDRNSFDAPSTLLHPEVLRRSPRLGPELPALFGSSMIAACLVRQ